jgi:hypothetical protein
MQGRVQKFMPIEKLVDLMEGLDLNRSTAPVITLRDRAMEEVHPGGKHIVEFTLGPICLHSWIISHNKNTRMRLRTILSSMLGSIMP